MSSESGRLSPEAKRLIRRVAFHTAQFIAEEAQLFAAELRDGADDIAASDALMAFATKLRTIGSMDSELLLTVANEGASGRAPCTKGTLH